MLETKKYSIWFVVGSQHLYGPGPLRQVHENARHIVDSINASGRLSLDVELKSVMTTAEEISLLLSQASNETACAGLIFWMHTFSPAKMWINGLKHLTKPFLHLHTQFNRDLPWSSIDMDFMNLNQAAHGDREFGYICTRLGLSRKVVAGHWADDETLHRIDAWMRAARAWANWQGARFCRIGDNMRNVAVTEGDKVAAEEALGFSVNGFGIGDLVDRIRAVTDAEVDALCETYQELYDVQEDLIERGPRHESLRNEGRIEIGLRAFLQEGGFQGFTDTFEDLHGLPQLPGLAVQRLMAEGYGFGGEGDWKTAALLRAMKVMAEGLPGGVSFMEDYTYHLPGKSELVLGAHMLEICPSIAAGKPRLEIHPLGIGGKADPVRLVFDARPGPAVNASLIDLGDRFRLVVNEVDVIEPIHPLPNLPVARALWRCRPDFKTASAAWIYCGGAHHTGFSHAITAEMLEDFAAMAGIEFALINADSRLADFR